MLDTLQTFAEIAIAMAGFSGVVVAFGRVVPEQARFRLQLLLTLNLEVVVFAMAPSVVITLFSEEQTWQYCIFTYAVVHSLHLLYSIFGYRESKGPTPLFDWILMGIGGASCVGMILLAILNHTQEIQFLYLSFVLFILSVAGTQFYRLLMEVSRGDA